MAFPTTFVNSKGLTVPFPIPSKPIPQSLKTNNLIQGFDAGNTQRRRKSLPRKSFELNWPLLELAAYKKLQDFFLEVGGSIYTFSWVHPVDKISYTVRCDMEMLAGEYHLTTNQGVHYYKCALKIVEEF